MKSRLLSVCLQLSLLLSVAWPIHAQSENSQEIADRYEQLLVRSPQTGPAFDRVVEWYSTQGGGLEVLQKKWQDAGGAPETRRPYLILQGLLAERLRNPKKAREFYQQALAEAGDPTQVARLLAILETTEGNFPAAAQAYQKALAVESLAPVDRMEIMRSLALLYQRSFEDEKALDVWRDALKRYPEDPYVLEEAGEAYLAAGKYEEASKTFTKLRDMSAKDPFRKVAASLRLGRTEEAAGKTAEAVRIYELALEETSEGSWINREVRARIEELFRRKDDLPGLLAYYEKRVTAVPQDYQSLAAQGVVLDELGRTAEAIDRTRAATKLAPDNVELRLLLIRRLSNSGDTAGALVEAEELAKPANAPVDAILALGNLQWALFQEKKDEKAREAALATWQRIAPEGSSDAARIAQLAEILASRDLPDAALAQWQRIIALTPSASDARQKVAEILEKRGDRKGAEAVLEGLVQEDRAVPENFLLLARIQDRLTWADAARATTEKGLALFPNDYELLNLAWKQAVEAKDAAAVEKLFPLLWKNVPNEFFAEDVSKRYVSFLEESGKEKDTGRLLAERLNGEAGATSAMDAVVLLRLALLQKDQDLAETALAALKKQDNAVRAARAASEVAQAFGSPEDQILALNNIAVADPRMAGDSLRAAARIQADNGKVDDALATVSQLIERTPADATLYGLYADLAARAGRYDLAVARLNEAVRYVEDASTLRLQLASLMQMQERTDEAAKVLQEAFEKEEREGRRMEIFRRQIELAMQAGTLDDLIAALREKQAKEQNGARYGAYLAEIFILQGDLITAREELTRSLGRNPDNPAAVARLLDLADRGGDGQEGLRLAARLVELQPSRENRVAYISRLFEANDLEAGRAAFEKARPEIVKDPTGWSAVLTSMQRAGLTEETDAVVEEIALMSQSGVEQKSELASLRLMQRDYEGTIKNLWEVVETGDVAGALEAVMGGAANASPGMPLFWSRYQPLTQIQSEVQNSLQQMFQSYRGRGYSSWARYQSFGGANAANRATPEQRAVVRALIFLGQLGVAEDRQKEFFERADTLLAKAQTPMDVRIMALSGFGYPEGVKKLAREQANDPNGRNEVDQLLLGSGFLSSPDMKDVMEKVQSRSESKDPKYAFEQQLNKLSVELSQAGATGGGKKMTPEQQAKLDALMAHPGLKETPLGRIQLATLVASLGQQDTALRLMEESRAEVDDLRKKSGQTGQMAEARWVTAQIGILLSAIKNDDEKAKDLLDSLLQSFPKQKAPTSGARYGVVRYSVFGNPSLSLAQASPELTQGDSEFPVSLYRALSATPSKLTEGVDTWFAKNATPGKLDRYAIGAFYGDWVAGRKEEAIKRIEAIHQKNPTPRSAALLLEAYEKQNEAVKALEVIDLAELQDAETTEVRNLRRVRLLRTGMRSEEARTLAEKMARGRVSSVVRDQLANELNLLGVPATQYQNLTAMGMGRVRGSRDRNSQLREQINKLVSDKRVDEAEKLALQILQRPLPARDDYNSANLRQTMVQSLKSMKRADALESELQDRLTKDPADLDAAVRLAELSMNDDASSAFTRLSEALKVHPKGGPGLGYALQFLQRSGDVQVKTAQIMATLIKNDPDGFYASGLQLHELSNLASSPEAGMILADAIAEASDENLRRLFMPARLSNQMMEAQFLSQMAEFSKQGGKQDQAIALLKRAVENSAGSLDQSFPVILQLAELQLAAGQKDAAQATMKKLVESSTGGRTIFGGMNNLTNVVTSMLMNRGVGYSATDQILRMGRLAQETGTLDLILKELEAQTPAVRAGVSTSLLVRTMMGRPEIGAEWRKAVESDNVTTGYFSLPMLTSVLKALSVQEGGSKLMIDLLGKVPEQYYSNYGGDYAMNCLAESLPLLKTKLDERVVKRHIERLVSNIMADPNGGQYLWYSQGYGDALNALIDIGRVEDAKKLLNMTSAARVRQNYGRQPTIERVEARLAALEGKGGNVQMICASAPINAEKLRVTWATTVAMESDPNEGQQSKALWEDSSLPVGKDKRPVSLEILAGPNAASLEKVAQVSKPELAGSTEIKVSAPMGLLQIAWTLPDGTKRWGPLTVFLNGENLIKNKGVPETKVGVPIEGFTTGQPGPTGPKSAVIFESSSVQTKLSLPLATVELNGMPMKLPSEAKETKPQLIAMTGWVRGSGQNGNAPRVVVKWIRENGTEGSDSSYYRQLGDGQWVQFFKIWSINESHEMATTIEKAREMSLSIEMNANGGYNNLYSYKGGWDGLQLVKLPLAAKGEGAEDWVAKGREAVRKKDDAAAVEAFTKAFKLNPDRTLQQVGTTMFTSFQNLNRSGEFFTLMSAPALYMWNPLLNRVVMQNEDLINRMVESAVAKGAPAAGQEWLRRMQQVSLSPNMGFVVESAVLREEIMRDSAKASAAQLLAALGFKEGKVDQERVQQLWAWRRSAGSAAALLEIADKEKKNTEMRDLLKPMAVPVNLSAAQQMLLAWLTAPEDAKMALEFWRQSLGLRQTQNSATFYDDADRALLLRIARTFESPRDLVAATKGWIAKRNSDADSQQRNLVEMLYAAAKQDSVHKDEYAKLWADAETAALKSENYNPARDRIRELVKRLMAAEEWERLEAVLALSLTNKALKSSDLQREFTQQRDLVAFARGKHDFAWPVAWCVPGTNSRKVTVRWQWNTRDVITDQGKYDTAVGLSDKPILPQISGQQKVEIWYGEMPAEMKVLGEVDGESSSGSLALELPAANGFLRAVAVFADKRIPGPMVPVLSGRRVYPAEGVSLQSLLTSGGRPLPAQALAEAGEAPDGSPAVRIGVVSEQEHLSYEGPEFTVQPGKFYVGRSWFRRAGGGSGTVSAEFNGTNAAGANSSLNMVLSERNEATGLWVLYTRAIPSYPQHTFWIPFKQVKFLSPRLWDMDPGTEVAGLEVLEIEGWKYGEWIGEIAMIRQGAPEKVDAAVLDRALALASIEPLTALDYQGDWLGAQALKAGRGLEVVKLYRIALGAEPNPLFARPKLWRIFNNLLALTNNAEAPDDVRREVAQLLHENRDRASLANWFAIESRYLSLAEKERKDEVKAAVLEELNKKLNDPNKGAEFLKAAATARTYKDLQPVSEFVALVQSFEDESLLRSMKEKVEGNKDSGLGAYDKIFAALAIEALLSDAKIDESWKDKISKGYYLSEKTSAPASVMFWPSLLGDTLATKKQHPELLLHLRQRGFDRMLLAKPDQTSYSEELIRAGGLLIATGLEQGNQKVVDETISSLQTALQARQSKLNDASLRLLLAPVDQLASAGKAEQSGQLVSLVEKDVRDTPALAESYAKYLKPVEAPTAP